MPARATAPAHTKARARMRVPALAQARAIAPVMARARHAPTRGPARVIRAAARRARSRGSRPGEPRRSETPRRSPRRTPPWPPRARRADRRRSAAPARPRRHSSIEQQTRSRIGSRNSPIRSGSTGHVRHGSGIARRCASDGGIRRAVVSASAPPAATPPAASPAASAAPRHRRLQLRHRRRNRGIGGFSRYIGLLRLRPLHRRPRRRKRPSDRPEPPTRRARGGAGLGAKQPGQLGKLVRRRHVDHAIHPPGMPSARVSIQFASRGSRLILVAAAIFLSAACKKSVPVPSGDITALAPAVHHQRGNLRSGHAERQAHARRVREPDVRPLLRGAAGRAGGGRRREREHRGGVHRRRQAAGQDHGGAREVHGHDARRHRRPAASQVRHQGRPVPARARPRRSGARGVPRRAGRADAVFRSALASAR